MRLLTIDGIQRQTATPIIAPSEPGEPGCCGKMLLVVFLVPTICSSVLSFAAEAQAPAKVYRIGWLSPFVFTPNLPGGWQSWHMDVALLTRGEHIRRRPSLRRTLPRPAPVRRDRTRHAPAHSCPAQRDMLRLRPAS